MDVEEAIDYGENILLTIVVFIIIVGITMEVGALIAANQTATVAKINPFAWTLSLR